MSAVNLQEQTAGVTPQEYQGIRDAFLHSVGLTSSQQLDECSFVLNPPSDKVQLFVRKVGSTKKPLQLIPDPSGVIGLDALDDDTFEVEVFASSTKPLLLLHKFTIVKNTSGVSVHNIDVNATVVETVFTKADQAFGSAAVLGQFTDRSGKSCNIEGKTGSNGAFHIVLPEGTINNLVATSENGIEIPKRGVIMVPAPSVSSGRDSRKPLSITIDVDSSSFGSALKASSSNTKVVALGDISGSMGGGSNMNNLRKSFLDMLTFCEAQNKPIALAAWDSWVDWCSTSYITTASQRSAAKSWIGSLNARGGNDMRYAIEDCMRKFPDAVDVFVMCDGDVSPFNPSGGHGNVYSDVPQPASSSCESSSTVYADSNWVLFRGRYPKTSFHFIALGSNASTSMQQMAVQGNGSYKEVTLRV